jgi:hypothetical protein
VERPLAQGGINSRELSFGDIVYTVAKRQDEADIRRLLAENATDGWIRLSFEREPDAFAAQAIMGPHRGIVIARDGHGELVGMCEWSARDCYVDGEIRLMAYLGGLRVVPRHRHRLSIVKNGFEAVRRLLHGKSGTPYALTSIASGNSAALRLLGANLPGMPRYVALDSFSTFALRPKPARRSAFRIERAGTDDLALIVAHLARSHRRYQFAPAWSVHDFVHGDRCRGLRAEDFMIVRRGPGLAGCVALWDQSAFKQTTVRGYSAGIGGLLPLLNLGGRIMGLPHLPAAGQPLRQIYLSHLAVADDDADLFSALIDAGLAEADARGFSLALTGLATRHPLAAALIRRHRPFEYRALLHLVDWSDGAHSPRPDARIPHVEIAVL